MPLADPGAAVVRMVLVTTVITPPALKWSLARHRRPGAPAAVAASRH
ncbi:MAG TPA: hypothetical protein PKA50_07465 [Gemmatimonadales bacterium]|nr:hypothetical protein [Gemmatimonadales bacterium]